MPKKYKILKNGQIVTSLRPGKLAGWKRGKIFGRLDCKSGIKMHRENRVFFHTLEDAVSQGYRPCKKCKPVSLEDFDKIKHLIPQCASLEEFYNS